MIAPSGQEPIDGGPARWCEQDGIGRIVLARPDRHNAVDHALAQALMHAVDRANLAVEAGRVAVVLLAATGPSFCVGGDLRGVADAADPVAYLRDLVDTAHAAIARLAGLPVPLVVAVHGAAAGAGLALVLAADVVLAAADAQFRFGYAAAGLSPDCGASALAERIGLLRATEFALTNRVMPAEEAQRLGLVNRLVDADHLSSATTAEAIRLRELPPAAVAATLALMRSGQGGLADRLVRERDTVVGLMATAGTQRIVSRFATQASGPPPSPGRGRGTS